MEVALLTAGKDKPYVLGLLSGLIANNVFVDFIGNDEMQHEHIVNNNYVKYYNLRGDQSESASFIKKSMRVLKYYLKLIQYAANSHPKIFHIIWLNKFIYFDCTILNIYYKILGKKLIYTAHNINMKERDGNDSLINRLSLFFMYHIVDHIFVHTNKMKQQLIKDYVVRENKVSVIPFGINNTLPISKINKNEARKKLNLYEEEKVILFFGNIAPYKGLEYLISAIDILVNKYNMLRLLIAGRIKGCETYWESIKGMITKKNLNDVIMIKSEYIPDEEVEVYFNSADVLIIPYKFIFQTGVLFLSYNFGLPAIASDVGSIREDIVEGKTGFICKSEEPEDLAEKIDLYFHSDLYKNLEKNRNKIIEYANEKYSWDKIGKTTCCVYNEVFLKS